MRLSRLFTAALPVCALVSTTIAVTAARAATPTPYTYAGSLADVAAGSGAPEGVSALNGVVLVADNAGNRILRMHGDDTVAGTTIQPSGAAGFSSPRQAAADPGQDGRIVVSDSFNYRAELFTASGNLIKAFGGAEMNIPRGVAFSSDAHLAIAQAGGHQVTVYDIFGNLMGSCTGTGTDTLVQPEGVAFDAQNHLWVADTHLNRILEFGLADSGQSTTCTLLKAFGETGSAAGQLQSPTGLAVSSAGRVFVANWGDYRVDEFTTDGEYVGRLGAGGDNQIAHPVTVSIDTNGDLYVADTQNNRVERFTVPQDGGQQPTPTATASVSPSSLDFGNVTVGDTSAPKFITVTNTGTAPLTFQAFYDVTPFQPVYGTDQPCYNGGKGIAPGASCTIGIAFKPSAAGAANRTTSMTSNASNGPIQVGLAGTGVAPTAPPAPPALAPISLVGGVHVQPLGPPTPVQSTWPTPDWRPRKDPKTGRYRFVTLSGIGGVEAQLAAAGVDLARLKLVRLSHDAALNRLRAEATRKSLQEQDGHPSLSVAQTGFDKIAQQAVTGQVLAQDPLPAAATSATNGIQPTLQVGPLRPGFDPDMTIYVLDGTKDPVPPKPKDQPKCLYLRDQDQRPPFSALVGPLVKVQNYLDAVGCKDKYVVVDRKFSDQISEATVASVSIDGSGAHAQVSLRTYEPKPPAPADPSAVPAMLARALDMVVKPPYTFSTGVGEPMTLEAPDASGSYRFQASDTQDQSISVAVREVAGGFIEGHQVTVSAFRKRGSTLDPLAGPAEVRPDAQATAALVFRLPSESGGEGTVVLKASYTGPNGVTESGTQEYGIDGPSCSSVLLLDGVTFDHSGRSCSRASYAVAKTKTRSAHAANIFEDAQALLVGLWNRLTGQNVPATPAGEKVIAQATVRHQALCTISGGAQGVGPNPAKQTTAAVEMVNGNGTGTMGSTTDAISLAGGSGCADGGEGAVKVAGITTGKPVDVDGKPVVELIVRSDTGQIIAAGSGNIIGTVDYTLSESGQIIAAGSGNIIAAGSGNATTINIVDAKTGQIIAAGSGNIIAAGSGNVIGAGAFNFNSTAPGKFALVRNGKEIAAGIIAAGSGNVIAAGSGNIIAAGSGNLLAAAAGALDAAGRGALVLDREGGTSADSVIGAGAGNIIAAGAGNIIAAGSGNIIAAGSGN